MESVEKRLKDLIEFVKCPETGSAHYGRWGILHREQRVYLDKLARDCLILINELEKENDEQYKRIMELEQDLVHADEKVFYRECNVTLRENEIKQQAIKQFAERLKEKLKNFCGTEYENAYYDVTKSFACNDIDETIKEFMG